MSKITTGIDRLLELLENTQGKISLQDASKYLNVTKEVVEEWAELLEQEGLARVTYKFSSMYMEYQKPGSKTVKKSVKKLYSERDAFRRKIDATIQTLHKDTTGFDDVKEAFESVQKEVKDELKTVRKELSELEQFDTLKKNVAKDIEKQKEEYQKFTKLFDEELKSFGKQYQDAIDKIKAEEKNIEILEKKIEGLKGNRKELEDKIALTMKQLKEIGKELDKKLADLRSSERSIGNTKKLIKKLTSKIDDKKEEALNLLIRRIGKRKEDILKEQEELQEKSKQKLASIESYAESSKKIYQQLKHHFDQKIHLADMVNDVDKDKNTLLEELKALRKRVDSFSILTSNESIQKELGDIESVIARYEKKEKNLVKRIGALLNFIKK